MTDLFGDLNTNEKIEGEKDVLGGFVTQESGAYTFVINNMYADQAASGARSVVMEFCLESDPNTKLNVTEYVTSGTAKGGKNYFENKAGNKQFLPGWATVDAICVLASGVGLQEQGRNTEGRMFDIYDKQQGKAIPQERQAFVGVIGKTIELGILQVRENKNVKSGDAYVPTNDERFFNAIDKVFEVDTHLTTTEKKGGDVEGTFYQKWVDKNTGVMKDRFKEVAGSPPGSTGGATTQSGGVTGTSVGAPPTAGGSMFDDDDE